MTTVIISNFSLRDSMLVLKPYNCALVKSSVNVTLKKFTRLTINKLTYYNPGTAYVQLL